MLRGATFVLLLGIGFVILGGAQILPILLRSPYALAIAALCVSVVGGTLLHRNLRQWGDNTRRERCLHDVTPLVEEWLPMLSGNYTPYVVEAAEKLGAARETMAVPTLLHVLEQTVRHQPPGWCDSAEAIVVALGKMGDRRALPLLHRLTSWRGIGFVSAVCEAIDRIEPETSLLRAASVHDLPQELLLRPADACTDSDPALLLRAGNGHL